jgi:hypothetical protein
MTDKAEKQRQRELRKAAWRLLRAGFVTLSYNENGEEVFTARAETDFTEEEQRTVLKAFFDAGPTGLTSSEAAEKTGLSLIKVRCIVGDIPE